jgi:DNA processing protein
MFYLGSRMPITEHQARLLALCRIKGVNWYLIAREAQRPDGLARLWAGEFVERSVEATMGAEILGAARPDFDARLDEARAEAERASEVGARLITVLDESYPTNLRLIFNLPPFLFVRGALSESDLYSVAVVGTRNASDSGIRRSSRMARMLAERNVTVVSGLARGIDTAAHTAALNAGGRTIAVIGTGIRRYYPAENRELSDRIAEYGAVVSQFWPDAPPATYTFPRRNVTMSGIAQGTVVIEASSTSGAKMQARLALEHGKKVFLLRSLVDSYSWAAKYAARPGATVVEAVDDVIDALLPIDRIRAADARREQVTEQLTFELA